MTLTAVPPAQAWQDYWREDTLWSSSALWQANARLLAAGLERFAGIMPSDTVLDIGCGGGHLAARLARCTAYIAGADISARMIELSRRRCAAFTNAEFYLIQPGSYPFENWGRFSLIVCNSVAQYFADQSEIERLILAAQSAALPGARMILSDLPAAGAHTQGIWTGARAFAQSLHRGYAAAFLKAWTGMALRGGDYAKITRQTPVLEFTGPQLLALAGRLALKAQVLCAPLTVNPGRLALLIQF